MIRWIFLWVCLSLAVTGFTQHVSLLFAGDVMQHDSQISAAYDKTTQHYDYSSYFKYVSPVIRQADIAVANLEVTHGGPPYKGYPQFSAPDELSGALKDAGFDLIITANNHSADRGKYGILRTLDVLDDLSLNHTGTFRNSNERTEHYPFILEENGLKLAFLNFTYGTNGLPVPPPAIVNIIDTAQIRIDLKNARSLSPDAIIVTVHWGSEYQHQPNQFQKEVARLCLENGATMVIGGHPHVLQPMELKDDQLTVWSLGNFVSNQRKRYTDGGGMVMVDLIKDSTGTHIADACYMLTWVYPKEEDGDKNFYVLPVTRNLELDSFDIDREAQDQMEIFANDSRQLLNTYNQSVAEITWQQSINGKVFSPQTEEPTDVIWYSVQLFATKTEALAAQIPAIVRDDYILVPGPDGLYRYMHGKYFDLAVAEGFRDYWRDNGFPEAFIVRLRAGKILK